MKQLIAWVRASQKCNQSLSNTHDITFGENKNVNLIILTILPKRLILDAWQGPECVLVDGCITVLKIQMKICKDGRQVKKESHLVLVFLLLPISISS